MKKLDQFLTDNYYLLSYLYDNSSPDNRICITQQEIADAIGLGRTKVNAIMQELKQQGYLVSENGHLGRYLITPQAIILLKNIKTVNKALSKEKLHNI